MVLVTKNINKNDQKNLSAVLEKPNFTNEIQKILEKHEIQYLEDDEKKELSGLFLQTKPKRKR